MNSEQLTALAEECTDWSWSEGVAVECFDKLRFANLVAAAVREECAKVCEERAGTVSMFATSRDATTHNRAVKGDAAAIRSMS